jgi:uncharacterized protein YuzE
MRATQFMTPLKEALPYLVLDLESALVHIGRGDVSDQLRRATIERWTYDEIADAAYLHLRVPQSPGAVDESSAGEAPGETVSVYDELGINLDTDSQGRLTGMEILGGRSVIAQLDRDAATSPRSP